MPITNKTKTKKSFLIDILREAYLTKEDAMILFERIREECFDALCKGECVNLFDLVVLEPEIVSERVKNNAFGKGNLTIPRHIRLKSRIYPRLNREWKEETNI